MNSTIRDLFVHRFHTQSTSVFLRCPSASLRCRWRSSCTESVLGTSAAFAPSQLGTRLLEQMLLRRRCASK